MFPVEIADRIQELSTVDAEDGLANSTARFVITISSFPSIAQYILDSLKKVKIEYNAEIGQTNCNCIKIIIKYKYILPLQIRTFQKQFNWFAKTCENIKDQFIYHLRLIFQSNFDKCDVNMKKFSMFQWFTIFII